MDRKLSDEQLDRIAKNLLQDFAPDAETLDEIAGSPQIWWGVRNRIETEKAARARGWFAGFRAPVLAFGALAVLICAGLTLLFSSFRNDPNPLASEPKSVQNPVEKASEKPEEVANIAPHGDSESPEISPKLNPVPEKVPIKTAVPKPNLAARNKRLENLPKPAANSPAKTVSPNRAEETKTDFIALSYAANTDSGQIVRVKVPSSMMVSLGVATNVEKGSELVSAEVVIGDDGLARAIRFIR
jgi:hypothetical protein